MKDPAGYYEIAGMLFAYCIYWHWHLTVISLKKPCHKKQENLNHEGTKDTKEESTKGFGFSFVGKTANEKAAFLKTVARFSK